MDSGLPSVKIYNKLNSRHLGLCLSCYYGDIWCRGIMGENCHGCRGIMGTFSSDLLVPVRLVRRELRYPIFTTLGSLMLFCFSLKYLQTIEVKLQLCPFYLLYTCAIQRISCIELVRVILVPGKHALPKSIVTSVSYSCPIFPLR